MKVKISFIPVLALALWLISCNPASKRTEISGIFKGISGQVKLVELLPDSIHVRDSFKADANGRFYFRQKISQAGLFYLDFPGERQQLFLDIEPGQKVEIEGEIMDSKLKYSLRGSPGSGILKQYFEVTKAHEAKVDSLHTLFMNSQSLPDFVKVKSRLDSAYLAIYESQRSMATQLVSKYPSSLASLFILNKAFGPNPLFALEADSGLYTRVFDSLSRKFPGNIHVMVFRKRVTDFRQKQAELKIINRNLEVGKIAPDIEMTDAKQKLVKLSSLRGKMVLIYFWESLNPVARQTNLELVPVYNSFKDKGFEIFAVSADKNKDLWAGACRIDQASWIQLFDGKGTVSAAFMNYGVTTLPRNFLVDKDGRMMATDVKPPELKVLLMQKLR